MVAYKYIIKVSKTGLIQLPDNPALFDKEVELIILSKRRTSKTNVGSKEFFDKWGGFLKNSNIESSKYDYLMEKHK